MLVPVPEAPVFTGLLVELPRGLAVAAIGYALFIRKEEEYQKGPPTPETEAARPNVPAA